MFEDRRMNVEPALLSGLTALSNTALSGYLPHSLQPILCGGRLVPVRKKDGGIRPIVVGEVLRAVIAKAAFAELS